MKDTWTIKCYESDDSGFKTLHYEYAQELAITHAIHWDLGIIN
jgi:hypothetical protein